MNQPIICKYCGKPIDNDNTYYTFGKDRYHESCFIDSAVTILLEQHTVKKI